MGWVKLHLVLLRIEQKGVKGQQQKKLFQVKRVKYSDK
jgi:hypothetical protein